MPTIEEKRRLTDIVLSRDEVRDVTGCAQRAAQRRELDALGIPYRVLAAMERDEDDATHDA